MNVLAIDQGTSATKAVGLGNQGETVLAWERPSGRPIGPAISRQDRRYEAAARALIDLRQPTR